MPFVVSRLLARRGLVSAICAISGGITPVVSRRHVLKCDERAQFINTPHARRHLPLSTGTINQFAIGSLAGELGRTYLLLPGYAFLIGTRLARSICRCHSQNTLPGSRLRIESRCVDFAGRHPEAQILHEGMANVRHIHPSLQVASRYGFTSLSLFRGAVRVSGIKHWDKTGQKFVFKATFVTTLMLAAFVHF